jgi:hypothetical protein
VSVADIRTLYPRDWQNFLERMNETPNRLRGIDLSAISEEDFRQSGELSHVARDLQEWAAYRGQQLARTVRGLISPLLFSPSFALLPFCPLPHPPFLPLPSSPTSSSHSPKHTLSLLSPPLYNSWLSLPNPPATPDPSTSFLVPQCIAYSVRSTCLRDDAPWSHRDQ